ncbi:uncharacterized protein LOC141537957 [Cotesia typhae]|uniref:uncharacterized protein LOC141525379 n=1 Tax=Cotesia typhae TaxID=2053667 RepID=UPI003D68EE3D
MSSSIKSCCIKGCTEKSRKEQGINLPVKFYTFPQNTSVYPWKESKRLKWINAVKKYVKNPKDWKPNKSTRICSVHFINNNKSEHPLHPSYVPSIFPEKKNTKNLIQSVT